jgi:hypothetical protein
VSAAERPWASYLIVFVASGCTLVLEIVAGRVLAPFAGVSIQTWTGAIGVVLAGISLGSYLGGVLADRRGLRPDAGAPPRRWRPGEPGGLPLASGLGPVTPRSSPLVLRIVLLTSLLFFAPSLLLGMEPPIAIRRTLADLDRAGKVVGRTYAASTAGSLAGAFLTGFVLVAHFGTRAIILSVGLTLIALGSLACALAHVAGPTVAMRV